MKRLRALLALLVLFLVAGGLAFHHLARRALPKLEGTVSGTGVAAPVEVLRDRWGVPHVFAHSDADAAFALGWVTAQDRLFQMDLLRHIAQGRLSELFGRRTLRTDRLFRTLDLHGVARRMLERARPEAREAVEAYARGVSAYVATLRGRLPIEFAILGHDLEPVRPDDFLGVLGYMAWGLNTSWEFDPLYEKLAKRIGEPRAAELFPYNFGGSPSAHPAVPETALALFRLSPEEQALLATASAPRASNNWVLGPGKTTTGRPILANDPHLGHGVPGVWYEVQLSTPTQDVIGVTIPGLPLVVIGHNRDIAWGFTNVMLDGADFFLEKLDPKDRGRVMSRGEWVALGERRETIQVKGEAPVTLAVKTTPHGPLVSELLQGEKRALSYCWNYAAASEANEIDGFYALARARDWEGFRAALRRFGAVAQNVAYADREGHIGLQTTGMIPRLEGRRDGMGFRTGWDGSQEWNGFIPFEQSPSTLDPPEGWLASANNPTVPRSPYYISNQWEPVDRYLRITEMIRAKEKLSVEDVKRMQSDATFVSAREEAPMILAAFDAQPPRDSTTRAALELLRGWDGNMRADQPAPTLFAAFYRRLFYEIFEDELGSAIAKGYRAKANLSAIMIRSVMNGGPQHWFDRQGTPAVEDKAAVVRSAFERAVRELRAKLGDDPRSWSWGRLHTLEFQHALGRGSRLLGLYFNRGPFAVPGHTGSVNKMEFGEQDFRVSIGPSMRQITDFSDLDHSLAVLPMGQSGIPASTHYDDLLALWLSGEYHPFPISRPAVEAVVAARLVLQP